MNKQEFLTALAQALDGYPSEDIQRTLEYYEEMIDDRIEDGLTEEEAVAGLGSMTEVVNNICDELPLSTIVKSRMKTRRRLRAWEIVLLAVGSPIWVSLLLALLCIMLAVYVSLWAVVISLYATSVAVLACVLGGLALAVVYGVNGNPAGVAASIGAALVCVGIGLLMWLASCYAAKGVIALGRVTLRGIKRMFVGKDGERR